jgi:glucose-6-phosphate isomerase
MTAANEAKLTNRQSWKALGTHYESIRNMHLRTLFEDDPERGERFTLEAAGLFLDYSKNRITDETVALLCQLAVECGLGSRIEAMFGGDKNKCHRRSRRLARRAAHAAIQNDGGRRQGCRY